MPVQVRDHALAIKDDMPKQGANRDFFVQNADRSLASTDGTTPYGQLATIRDAGTRAPSKITWETLQKIAPGVTEDMYMHCSTLQLGELKKHYPEILPSMHRSDLRRLYTCQDFSPLSFHIHNVQPIFSY